MTQNSPSIQLSAEICPLQHGLRLDKALAQLFPDYSRAQHQSWIKQQAVSIDGQAARQNRQRVQHGQLIKILADHTVHQENWQAQNIPLCIAHEDEDLLVINKPAGLTVHPGAGQADHTLVNALKYYLPSLELLPRAGLVHRLDKDTSGLLLVAKTSACLQQLTQAMQQRQIARHYLAFVQGVPLSGATIDAPIGRDPVHRTKMAVRDNGKAAQTHYAIVQRFSHHSLLKVTLGSGRTHQIRVHMAHIHHPLVGDPTYGMRYQAPNSLSPETQQTLQTLGRQALHAYNLSITHPTSGKSCQWQAKLPEDLERLRQQLTQDHSST